MHPSSRPARRASVIVPGELFTELLATNPTVRQRVHPVTGPRVEA